MGRSGNVDGIGAVRMFPYKKQKIGNLNVIPQPQEVSQDIQAHPFVINPQTGIVYPEGNEKLQRTAEFFSFLY